MRHKVLLAVVALSWAAMEQCHGHDASRNIVDVSFDGPYQQIPSSKGDNWTPTWGRDDTLYTGSDDGVNFGEMVQNAVAFGKLTGSGPDQLKATTINSMGDYREDPLFRPIESYLLGGVTYRLGKCDDRAASSESVCLQGGLASTRLFASERFSSASFAVVPDEVMTEELDTPANEYAFAVGQAGTISGESRYFIGRVPKVKLPRADLADWTFLGKRYAWVGALNEAVPVVNARSTDSAGATWKITSSYSIDGKLYMFVARIDDYGRTGEPQGRSIFRDASIVKSTDSGVTWARSAKENHDAPMFPGQSFGAPYFVWYGKDGASKVDNADKYVYAISNNGYWESGDYYILGRVLRSRLADLSAKDWTFFQSGDGMKDESWTLELSKATPVLSDPGQAGMTGVTYIEGLRRYVMVSWHYPSHGLRDVEKNGDTFTVLEFFEAPQPWGPWTRFKAVKTAGLGWYTPIIGQRFQSKDGPSAVHAVFYATALDWKTKAGETNKPLYKLNYMPITLSTAPIRNSNPKYAGGR